MSLGEMLQTCREKAGLSQEQLAVLLNRTQSCISKFEKNKRIPDLFTFKEWLIKTNAAEVGAAYLFGVDAALIVQNMLTVVGGFISIAC